MVSKGSSSTLSGLQGVVVSLPSQPASVSDWPVSASFPELAPVIGSFESIWSLGCSTPWSRVLWRRKGALKWSMRIMHVPTYCKVVMVIEFDVRSVRWWQLIGRANCRLQRWVLRAVEWGRCSYPETEPKSAIVYLSVSDRHTHSNFPLFPWPVQTLLWTFLHLHARKAWFWQLPSQ